MKRKQETSIKKAVIINAISKYGKIIINLLFSVVLARLLSPEDYGVVAVVTVFTTFFSVFSDMGLSTAVIQNKELTKEDESNIYTFSVYLGIVLAGAFCVFSYPMSLFYKDMIYFPIGCLLAISLFFNTVNMIPNAVIMKQKLFTTMSIRNIVVAILNGAIMIILALCGFKYYSIVFSSVITSIITFAWNKRSTQLHFLYKTKKESIQKVIGFSVFQFAFSLVNYFARNLDNLLTGKFIGKAMLGYYSKAYSLMQYPTSNLTHVITPVLHPILSEYQNDEEYIYKVYLKIVKVLSIIGIFVSAICFLASGEIVLIMFGEKWKQAIPCFKWLSISVWAQVITASAGSIFQSIGRVKNLFYCGTFNAILNILMIIIGVMSKDIVKLSVCVTICYNIHFFTSYFFLIKLSFKKSYFKFLTSLWREIVIGGCLIFGILVYPFNVNNIIFSLVTKMLFLGVIFVIMVVLTGEWKMVKKLLLKK